AAHDDPRGPRNLLPGEMIRVAGSVPALVTRADDRPDVTEQPTDAREQPLTLDRVHLDQLAFLGAEGAGLVDDLVRDPDLAHVVEQRGELRRAAFAGTHTQLVGYGKRQFDDIAAVAAGVRVVG